MKRITQVIRYEVDGETYRSYVEAESAIVDMFGEHIDGICAEIEKETGNQFPRFSAGLIKLVEKMWRDRATLAPLLGMTYSEHGDLAELARLQSQDY